MWLETVIKHTFYFMTAHHTNILGLENLSIWEKEMMEDKEKNYLQLW